MGRELDIAVETDVGMVRQENQDHHGVLEPTERSTLRDKGVLVVVADGMGGHSGGTIASHTAVDSLLEAFQGTTQRSMRDILDESVRSANQAVRDKAEADPKLADMGTTCVALLVRGRQAMIAHLGDSRAYLTRNGAIEQVTRDHTYLNELIDIGLLTPEQAKGHPDKNIITRCVGMKDELDIDFNRRVIEPADKLILCSDGLTNFVTDETIHRLVEENAPAEAASELVRLANEAGGEDNITVAVVRVNSTLEEDPELAALDCDDADILSSKVTPVIKRDQLGPDINGSDEDTMSHVDLPKVDVTEPLAATDTLSRRDLAWYWVIGAEVLALILLQLWIGRF